jgi:hypothetical protein
MWDLMIYDTEFGAWLTYDGFETEDEANHAVMYLVDIENVDPDHLIVEFVG